MAVDPQVVNWRIEQLNRAGVAPEVSQALALTESDLQAMVRAKTGGCDDETLLAIFDELEPLIDVEAFVPFPEKEATP